MREVTQEDARIRQFLLGDPEEAEREQLEELFLTDSSFRDKVLMVENELIEEYLEGELNENEIGKFRSVFEATPEQSRKLKLARSIRNYAKSELAHAIPLTVTTTGATETPEKPAPRSKALVYLAMAAAITVVVFGSLWVFRRVQSNQQAVQERNRHAAIESELAAANATAPESSESPEPGVISLMLASVSTRSSGPQPHLSLGSGVEAFDLWLLPTTTQYEVYNATLKRVASQNQFKIPGLRLLGRDQAKVVRLRIPAHLLSPGLHEVALTGVAAEGQFVDAGTFTFQVTGVAPLLSGQEKSQ